MSIQRVAPINRQAISAATTFGTTPVTISIIMIAKFIKAAGACELAGAISSISAG